MKFEDFKYCIVVDDENQPMVWSPPDEQLCYCQDEFWEDDILPLKVVTVTEARRQIRLSKKNRKRWGYENDIKYKLIPVKIEAKEVQ